MSKKSAQIAQLNDAFRTSLGQAGNGTFVTTIGVRALSENIQAEAFARLQQFSDFNADNDPHKEHDFGAFDIGAEKFFWKIDYYDVAYNAASEDPADVKVTRRVMTLMLANEY